MTGTPVREVVRVDVRVGVGDAPPVAPLALEIVATPTNFTQTSTINVYNGPFEVDWGDGNFIQYQSGTPTAASQVPTGTITLRSVVSAARILSFSTINRVVFSTNTFKTIDIVDGSSLTSAISMCANLTAMTSFNAANTGNIESFTNTWLNCSGLTIFPLIDISASTQFTGAWDSCSGLTGFPLLDFSNAASLINTWSGCTNLESIPLLNTSKVTNFLGAWGNCNSLSSFPLLDFSKGTSFNNTWLNNTSLISLPLIDTSSGVDFNSCFFGCINLQCLSSINTLISTNGTSMFHNNNSLVAPDAAEQALIAATPGIEYINPGACP